MLCRGFLEKIKLPRFFIKKLYFSYSLTYTNHLILAYEKIYTFNSDVVFCGPDLWTKGQGQ